MAEHNQYMASANHYPPTWRKKRTLRPEAEAASRYSWIGPSHPAPKTTFIVSLPKRAEPTPVDEVVFQKLVSQWRKETAHHSILTKKVIHPAYQRIIGMGPGVIPLILREMKNRPGHWFWALDALTQGKESPAQGCKDLDEATEAWLVWGEAKNHL